ncbi:MULTISPECIES: RNA polymerase sigma factor [Nocardioides]|uniref:RNA polymerase sigma factor n=1 Tax=Nocardioides vastitatis TaxID=2568655 RepID=A0ABW0ZA58_9ACTN|nr:sigma-70 family RNA polymerase sigma factor [Nocardioides sp.]THJ05322.1 sigma-70 family RNA polymerase sigma factor [Nocardioides sp.]
MTTDDDVVAAAKRGDPDAWRELYRAHANRLLVWLQSRWSGDESPEDIASATWLVAAEKIAGFHGNSEEFAGWLFGIARNHAANVRRRAARRDAVSFEDDAQAIAPGPEPAASGDDWTRRILATLPERERDVLTCREVLDMDVATTAAALGISPVAVRVAHHRALKRLRGQVTDRHTE